MRSLPDITSLSVDGTAQDAAETSRTEDACSAAEPRAPHTGEERSSPAKSACAKRPRRRTAAPGSDSGAAQAQSDEPANAQRPCADDAAETKAAAPRKRAVKGRARAASIAHPQAAPAPVCVKREISRVTELLGEHGDTRGVQALALAADTACSTGVGSTEARVYHGVTARSAPPASVRQSIIDALNSEHTSPEQRVLLMQRYQEMNRSAHSADGR